MKEHTEEMLAAEVIGVCWNKGYTIEEITAKIYKNNYAKNIVRVYQCCEILMSRGLLVPKFKSRKLTFQIDQESLKK